MPNSKLAFFRYMLIDRMLRNRQRKFPTKEDLLEACHERFGVRSVSTIEKDLNAMRLDLDAPIAYDKRNKGYYYSDSSFELFSVNLSGEQLMALQFVETFLEEFRDISIFSEFSDAVDKVLDGLEITKTFSNDAKSVKKFIQIDKSPYFKGRETLSSLIQFIADKQVIQIHYRKFKGSEEKSYTLHPYLLKEYENLWYLTGYVENYKEVRIFGVDRITSLAREDGNYLAPEEVHFDQENFFKNCIGITALNEKPQNIILSFTPYFGNFIKAKPIHHSQQVMVDNEEEYRISLYLVINHELVNMLLSYGAFVKVIEPDTLRERMKQEYKNALEKY